MWRKKRECEKLSVSTMSGSGSQIQGQSFEKFGMSPGEWKPKNEE
jgi:hypothetical protein